jgi:hypothetical protein
LEEKAVEMKMPGRGMGRGMGSNRASMMRFHRARFAEVTSPVYDAQAGEETVSLNSTLEDEDGAKVGELKVSVRFEYLMQDLRALGWWQSDLAYLVDTSGRYLAKSEATEKGQKRLLGKIMIPWNWPSLNKCKKSHSEPFWARAIRRRRWAGSTE